MADQDTKLNYEVMSAEAVAELHARHRAKTEGVVDAALAMTQETLPEALSDRMAQQMRLQGVFLMHRCARLRAPLTAENLSGIMAQAAGSNDNLVTFFATEDARITDEVAYRERRRSTYNDAQVAYKDMQAFRKAAAKVRWSSKMDAVFKGQDRIYLTIPQGSTALQERIANILSSLPPLRENDPIGYTITDWAKGLAVDATGKQTVKIGRLLNKYAPYALPDYEGRDTGNLMVVISRNVDDIARASTNRGWNSCAGARAGRYTAFAHLAGSIRDGMMVAYLVKPSDPNVNDPQARLMINPYFYNGSVGDVSLAQAMANRFNLMTGNLPKTAWETSYNIYGQVNDTFKAAVQAFVDDHFNTEANGEYKLADSNYGESSYTVNKSSASRSATRSMGA